VHLRSDAHSVSHGSATPSEIVERYFLSSKIFSCYSRSNPAQPRTSVVSKPEQNLVLLVRDPGTPHVQSVPELTGHFRTGDVRAFSNGESNPILGWPSTASTMMMMIIIIMVFMQGSDLFCELDVFHKIGKKGNFIWPKRVCSFGDATENA